MKKYTFSVILFFIIILLATTFISCESSVDEEVTPDTSQDSTLFPVIVAEDSLLIHDINTDYALEYKVSAKTELKEVTITVKDVLKFSASQNNLSNKTSYEGSFAVSANFDQIGSMFSVFIKATTIDGNTTTKSVVVIVKQPTPIIVYENLRIGGQTNGFGKESFIALRRAAVYTLADAKQNISQVDLVYFESPRSIGERSVFASFGDTLAGMVYNDSISGLQTWDSTQIRTTILKKASITQAKMENIISGTELIEVFEKGELLTSFATAFDLENIGTRLNFLEEGQIFTFKTADDNYGIFLIEEIVQADSNVATDRPKLGTISITIRITY